MVDPPSLPDGYSQTPDIQSSAQSENRWLPGWRTMGACSVGLTLALAAYDLAPVLTLPNRVRSVRDSTAGETTLGEFRDLVSNQGMAIENITNLNALLIRYYSQVPKLVRLWNGAVLKYELHQSLNLKSLPTSRIMFLKWGLDDATTLTATEVSNAFP